MIWLSFLETGNGNEMLLQLDAVESIEDGVGVLQLTTKSGNQLHMASTRAGLRDAIARAVAMHRGDSIIFVEVD